MKVQSTRPQTVGYGLTDSPGGVRGVDHREAVVVVGQRRRPRHRCFTDDQILDNVMLYWLSGTSTTSARLYWEIAAGAVPPDPDRAGRMHDLPGRDDPHLPAVGRGASIPTSGTSTRSTLQGGHFAAWEQPELFVDEVRSCFASMR